MSNNSPSLLYYILQWFTSALAVLVTAKLVPGFNISGFGSALWAAIIIGIANIVLWPILMFLTLPINILTLGLFTFVVNGALLKICAALLSGFEINGWFPAIIGAIVLAIVSAILNFFIS